jgi:hypothetical protein
MMKTSQREVKAVGSARMSYVSPFVAMVGGRDAKRGYLGGRIEMGAEEEGVEWRYRRIASGARVKVVVVDPIRR